MSKYLLRKNFTGFIKNSDEIIRGKVAFKTKTTCWLETENPVIILVSVHSAFHDEIDGDLKMSALLSIIKNHVKGDITVLFADQAHLKVTSLHYHDDTETASSNCLNTAEALYQRYHTHLEGCKIVYWHSYICQDRGFIAALKIMQNFYHTDSIFRALIHQDAEATYNPERMKYFPNKSLFIERAIDDLLGQCAAEWVLSQKGYRFQFYSGSSYASIGYTNCKFISEKERISWIDVFLAIEKKSRARLC